MYMTITNESLFSYWYEKGKKYRKSFRYTKEKQIQEKVLVKYLNSISPFTSVLELGCGFGRITKLLLTNFERIEKIVAVNWSPYQIYNAKENLRNLRKKPFGIEYIISDIASISFKEKFDLVILTEVLQHIPPYQIYLIVEKLKSFSKKHIISIDNYENTFETKLTIDPDLKFYTNISKKLFPHTFNHPYHDIYGSSGLDVIIIPIIKENFYNSLRDNQYLFHIKIN